MMASVQRMRRFDEALRRDKCISGEREIANNYREALAMRFRSVSSLLPGCSYRISVHVRPEAKHRAAKFSRWLSEHMSFDSPLE